jgi:hypothetical protein
MKKNIEFDLPEDIDSQEEIIFTERVRTAAERILSKRPLRRPGRPPFPETSVLTPQLMDDIPEDLTAQYRGTK